MSVLDLGTNKCIYSGTPNEAAVYAAIQALLTPTTTQEQELKAVLVIRTKSFYRLIAFLKQQALRSPETIRAYEDLKDELKDPTFVAELHVMVPRDSQLVVEEVCLYNDFLSRQWEKLHPQGAAFMLDY